MVCIQPIFLVTLPFWWMAMFRDLFKIPEYVSASNRDPTYVNPKKEAIKVGAAPPFNFSRSSLPFPLSWTPHHAPAGCWPSFSSVPTSRQSARTSRSPPYLHPICENIPRVCRFPSFSSVRSSKLWTSC